MAKLCENCFHCDVCRSSQNENSTSLIDSVGCVQFINKDCVVVLPAPVKPHVKVDLKVNDQKVPYFVDKVVVYRNGGVDIYARSEKGQGTYVFGPEDLGTEVFLRD